MRIVLVGFGVVGRALLTLLEQRRGALYEAWGFAPRVVGVVDSRGAAREPSGLGAATLLARKSEKGTVAGLGSCGVSGGDAAGMVAEIEADVMVEATPSRMSAPREAMENIKAAFRTGKHVVSVNKAPLATAMPALRELAAYNRVQFRFSGTVGGGTPVLAWARECATGDEIIGVRAILNGTTNFILSMMHERACGFDEALAEAVRLGYAETDPSTDIDGIDTATKLVIFANWVLNRPLTLGDVRIEGIRGLSWERVADASRGGRVLKLIGEIGDTVSVQPREVPANDPLNAPASLNATTLTLASGGQTTLIGRGAGGAETATAILRDLLDIWRNVGQR